MENNDPVVIDSVHQVQDETVIVVSGQRTNTLEQLIRDVVNVKVGGAVPEFTVDESDDAITINVERAERTPLRQIMQMLDAPTYNPDRGKFLSAKRSQAKKRKHKRQGR
jgi:hypothetical protein